MKDNNNKFNMKYTIAGICQKTAINLKLDVKDILILNWLADFYIAANKETIDGETMAWVKYEYLCDEMPILGIAKKRLGLRLKKLSEKGLISHHCEKGSDGTYTYYKMLQGYYNLKYSPKPTALKKSTPTAPKSSPPVAPKSATKDSPINIDSPKERKYTTPSSKRVEAKQLYDQLQKPVSLLFKKWIENRNENRSKKNQMVTSIDDNLVFLQNLHKWKQEGYDLVHLMNHNLKNQWEQLHPPKHHQPDDVMERQKQNTIDQNNIDCLYKSFGGFISRKIWQSYYEKVPSAFDCGVNQFINLNSFNFIEIIPTANKPLYKLKVSKSELTQCILKATENNEKALSACMTTD